MKILCMTLLLLALAPEVRAEAWSDDFEEAKAQAKAENRFMLMNFTGSDWCGWCKRLDGEVFSKSEFKDYAAKNLVLVKLDFPRGSSLKKKVAAQNEKLAKEFGIKGFPSIILLDPEGGQVAQTGYKAGGAEAYVQHLEELLSATRAKIGPVKAAALATTAAAGPGAGADYRTWTSSSGKTIDARLEQRVGDKLYLRTRENKLITIDSASLSPDDQSFLSNKP